MHQMRTCLAVGPARGLGHETELGASIFRGTRLHPRASSLPKTHHTSIWQENTGTGSGAAPIPRPGPSYTDGPNSTVSQRSKGDTSSMSAPTRTAAEPGASAASGGASGASANGVSCEFPTP